MTTSLTTWVAVFALLLAYLALVTGYLALRTLAALRRDSALLARGSGGARGGQSLLEATQRYAEYTATVAEKLDGLQARVETTREQALDLAAQRRQDAAAALRNVALVRYDAFTGMSGRLSFSLALLDERGDGVTISALAGQTDTRVYAKSIAAGRGEQELSPEESQAVGAALRQSPAASAAPAAPAAPAAQPDPERRAG